MRVRVLLLTAPYRQEEDARTVVANHRLRDAWLGLGLGLGLELESGLLLGLDHAHLESGLGTYRVALGPQLEPWKAVGVGQPTYS